MLNAAKKINPLVALKSGVKILPMEVRMSLWILIGKAMRLPVDKVFRLIDLQLTTAKRSLQGKRARMTIAERLQMAKHAKKTGMAFRNLFTWIIAPDSLIKWLKRYQERKANELKGAPKVGRPWISQVKVDAILIIYDSGLTGLKRIKGEMEKCGLSVAKSTVRKVLTQNGRAPTDPDHKYNTTWGQFLKQHTKYLVGADFIQIPVGLLGRIVNHHIFFAIEHDTRKVHVLGITENPTDEWTSNVIRSHTMDEDPLTTRKYWIMDNDSKYGPKTETLLGKKYVNTSIKAPDMNSVTERFVKSIKHKCLNHAVFLNPQMLADYVREYEKHYNEVRPHQGIGNKPIGE